MYWYVVIFSNVWKKERFVFRFMLSSFIKWWIGDSYTCWMLTYCLLANDVSQSCDFLIGLLGVRHFYFPATFSWCFFWDSKDNLTIEICRFSTFKSHNTLKLKRFYLYVDLFIKFYSYWIIDFPWSLINI